MSVFAWIGVVLMALLACYGLLVILLVTQLPPRIWIAVLEYASAKPSIHRLTILRLIRWAYRHGLIDWTVM